MWESRDLRKLNRDECRRGNPYPPLATALPLSVAQKMAANMAEYVTQSL